ncbi:hypothetical protein MTO98_26660 [Mucilaginibacter sp. SMC90]|uniref:hypothetical protein n=1 Tax=Mucilaginibacter sp. SMC90 TaxID=2929803 RepID=UPI001FB41E03|nr:hypothetical protein [Mucilaginibacter sp. SMC90]UOE47997.1 hypothetical protein MTO98_26660 [Mucilaginibacter sp. SMC90]
MKKPILVTLFILAGAYCYAQTDTAKWTKTDAKWYGTPKEKREQQALWDKAGYELYRLIGYKEYYANGIATYLQANGYNMDETRYIKGGSEFIFAPRISTGGEPKLYLKYWVNADKRITKVKITGHPVGLARLFIQYWPTDIQWTSTAQLHNGVVAKKMLIDETITYNNKTGVPFIEISK